VNFIDESSPSPECTIRTTINGEPVSCQVQAREHLADFLRRHLGLTGTHLGCEHGVCGACTVIVDGKAVRGCLMLAVQIDGADVVTIEGTDNDPVVRALKNAFEQKNSLQCGFCTPAMLLTAAELLRQNSHPSREVIRDHLSGNYCRCTGYQSIVEAVQSASEALSGSAQ
jgi:aerobic carbon-monoxide dehydrogenase small subunit